MQPNELRGLPYKFSIVLREFVQALMKKLQTAREQAQERLPSMPNDSLHERVRHSGQPHTNISAIERSRPRARASWSAESE